MRRMLEDWIAQMTALFPACGSTSVSMNPGTRTCRQRYGRDGSRKLYLEHPTRTAELVRHHGKRAVLGRRGQWRKSVRKISQMATGLPEGRFPSCGITTKRRISPGCSNHQQGPRATDHRHRHLGVDTIVPDFRVSFANIDGLRDGRRLGTLGIINTNWADDAQVLY
jgi:hypothetical protein